MPLPSGAPTAGELLVAAEPEGGLARGYPLIGDPPATAARHAGRVPPPGHSSHDVIGTSARGESGMTFIAFPGHAGRGWPLARWRSLACICEPWSAMIATDVLDVLRTECASSRTRCPPTSPATPC